MGLDVFISYSHHDKAAADAACAMLESSGVRAWIAPRDVRPGVEYGAEIVEAIERCRVLVLIFSESANHSGQILREVERAVSKGIPIVPVRIEEVLPTKSMGYFLGTIHWLEAMTPPLEQHLRQLVDIVGAILSRDGGGAPGGNNESFRAQASARPRQAGERGTQRIVLFGLLGAAAIALVSAATVYLTQPSVISQPPVASQPPVLTPPVTTTEDLLPETVPYISDRDRAAIRTDYLPAPDYKAFAIGTRLGFATGQASEEAAKTSAHATCERLIGNETRRCEIYAVGNKVVLASGKPPMPPAPWVVRNPAVEKPFAVNQAPLQAANYKAAMERYAAGQLPKALAASSRGYAAFYGQSSQDEAMRRALEFCGSNGSIACLVVALDNVFVVAVPETMKAVALFHPASEASIAADARGVVAGRLANAISGWNAVAIGAGGRPGLMLRAASEQAAVDGALADCARQDHSCRVIAIGPFLVEPLPSAKN
jgi:TIR domain-containing protein